MGSASCERLVPLGVAADAVTPAHLDSAGYGAADLHPTYFHKNVHGPTIHMVARAPPARKDCKVPREELTPPAIDTTPRHWFDDG